MARTDILDPGVVLGVTLDQYQKLMRFPPAAFNGILRESEAGCYDCAAIWTQRDRDGLALALAHAEQIREQELGYFTAPKYVNDEQYEYSFPLLLDKKLLIAVGSEAFTVIQSGAALVLGPAATPNDPVTLVVATTVTDPSEICLFYPGEDVQITPSKVTISGGNATILIPRPRLLKPTIDTNCEPAPDYYDNNNFLTTIDVKRRYTDPSDGAFHVWHGDSCNCNYPFAITTLTETTQLCYSRIEIARISKIELYPATYVGGTWTIAHSTKCNLPDHIRISYLSGRVSSVQTQMDTIRLAHTLLPEISPATDDLCKNCWEGDQSTEEMPMTPYGNMVGAVKAWSSDSRAKVGFGGKTPRMR